MQPGRAKPCLMANGFVGSETEKGSGIKRPSNFTVLGHTFFCMYGGAIKQRY